MNQTKSENKAMFNRMVKGKNYFTPKQIDFIEYKHFICELSTGNKMIGNFPVGVTYLNTETGEIDFELSKSFHAMTKKEAMEKAKNYIKTISKRVE